MKILFLDLDGVCNSYSHFLREDHEFKYIVDTPTSENKFDQDIRVMLSQLDDYNVFNLKYIFKNVADLKVVLSTAWRNTYSMELFVHLFQLLDLDGSRLIGKTPSRFSGTSRQHEIAEWLEDYEQETGKKIEINQFVILDDKNIIDLDHKFFPRFVRTYDKHGLTIDKAFDVIKLLKPNFKEPRKPRF